MVHRLIESLAHLLILFYLVSARLYREPVSKSNRPIVMNAIEFVVFPGAVNRETRSVLRFMDVMQGCGSALIICGSESTKFSEFGSGSSTKNHKNFQKSKILLIFKSEPKS